MTRYDGYKFDVQHTAEQLKERFRFLRYARAWKIVLLSRAGDHVADEADELLFFQRKGECRSVVTYDNRFHPEGAFGNRDV